MGTYNQGRRVVGKLRDRAEFDIGIDQNNLDDEWLGQASLYFEYAANQADARGEVEQIKNRLEVLKADIGKAVRDDPKKFGLEKVTERAVDEVIALHPGVQGDQELLVRANHKVEIIGAAVRALDHRRKALEKLVELFLANYFSKPQSSSASSEHVNELEKRRARRKTKR